MEEEEVNVVERFRESHHAVARMFAAGMTHSMIRQKTGMSHRRLTLLYVDPTFRLLITHYAQAQVEKWEEVQDIYAELAVSNMVAAERMLADKIAAAEDADEFLPTRELLMITADRGDRFGYSKHSVHEHKHDFAAAMDRAIARSAKVKQIEAQVEDAVVIPSGEAVALVPSKPQPSIPAPRPTAPPRRLVSGPLTRRRVA